MGGGLCHIISNKGKERKISRNWIEREEIYDRKEIKDRGKMGEKEGHTVDKYERQGEKLRDRERGGY